MKQVDRSHYQFENYLSKERWASLWHQLHAVTNASEGRVLEIGPGPGVFKAAASIIGLKVETLDIDPDLNPDHLGSATSLPFEDKTFSVSCAFQVLEHLPYENFLPILNEMKRVTRDRIIISLPDAKKLWRYRIYIPKAGYRDLFIARPRLRTLVHKFDGEHYWEINKRDYPLVRISNDISRVGKILSTYRVPDNTYHRFFEVAVGESV